MHPSLLRARAILIHHPKRTKTPQIGAIHHFAITPTLAEQNELIRAMIDTDQPLESYGWARSVTVTNEIKIHKSNIKETRYWVEVVFPGDTLPVIVCFFEKVDWAKVKEILRPIFLGYEKKTSKELYEALQIAVYGTSYFRFTMTAQKERNL